MLPAALTSNVVVGSPRVAPQLGHLHPQRLVSSMSSCTMQLHRDRHRANPCDHGTWEHVWHRHRAAVAVGTLTTTCVTSGSSRRSCSPRTPTMGSWPRGERSGPVLERYTDDPELKSTGIHVVYLCSGLGSRGADSGSHSDAYKPSTCIQYDAK